MAILIVGEKPSVSPCNQFRSRCRQYAERLHRRQRLHRIMVCRTLGWTEISERLRQRLGTEMELFAAPYDSRKLAVYRDRQNKSAVSSPEKPDEQG